LPNSRISRGSRVEAVIRAACRRRFLVLAVEQLAPALALVLGGGILMLLLGTQILNWYWLVLLAVTGLALASTRMRTRMATPYRVAQLLDRRFELRDSLSTAWFLLSRTDRPEDFASRFQIERAEANAASLEPSQAFPFTGRSYWALTGALAAVALGLFAARYLATSSLSLERPLIEIHLASVFERVEKSIFAKNRPASVLDAVDRRQANLPQSSEAQPRDGRSGLPNSRNAEAGKPNEMSGGVSPTQKNDAQGENRSQDTQAGNRQSGASTAQSNAGNPAQPKGGNPASSQQAKTSERQADRRQGSSGLMNKMKDALSGLMAKMRPAGSSQKSPQNGERSSNEQRGEDQMAVSQDPRNPSQQNAQNDQASEKQSTEGQAQGQTTEKAQASQGRNSDQSPDAKSSDAHSGVGRQNGQNDVKEAEQLKAMGKLEEIIGKRSANVTGEVMVETPSGKQQLKTQYSGQIGHHADLGGEINRDEIPLMYQQYVREYMEEVRKQPVKSGQ